MPAVNVDAKPARAAAHVVIALLVGSAGWAQAAPRTGVIARVPAGAPVDQRQLEAALGAVVVARGHQVVLDPAAAAADRRAAGAVTRERLATFARVRELTAEGWRAYLAVENAFAEARLAEARRAIESIIELDGALEVLADVSLRLGAVRLKAGRTTEAGAAFALAATLAPDREGLEREFAPDVVTAYQKAAAARAAGRAELEIVSVEGAALEIDGVPVGASPLRIAVAVGEHVVVARAPGRVAAGQLIAVARAGTRLELPLDEDLIGRTLGAGGKLFAIGVDEAAAAVGLAAVMTYGELDEVIFVSAVWRNGQPTLLGQRCRPEPDACGAVKEVRFAAAGQLAAASRQLVTDLEQRSRKPLPPILLEDTRLTEPEPAPKGKGGAGITRPGPRRPWWKNPWLWVGVGAAATIGTGAVILLADDPTTVVIETVTGPGGF